MDSLVKGIPADLRRTFFDRLRGTFPEVSARWQPGEEVADVAFKAGQQQVIDWIKQHARIDENS